MPKYIVTDWMYINK